MRQDTHSTPKQKPASTTPGGAAADRDRDAKDYQGGADKSAAKGDSSGKPMPSKGKPGDGGTAGNGNPEIEASPGLVDPRRETGRDILAKPTATPPHKIDDNPGEGDAPLTEGYDA